ncbi:PH domain-containing protein [Haloplanus halophilus]|uniref:PH domain-containing protein n=1 Tax=Haloplanus halophilus TaxID=2949993 RepID=UPI00203E3F3D|nr:PH domain-containing protein [Haloplanus sp. GDY1]
MKLAPLSVPYRVVERGGSIVFAAVFLFSGASAAFGPVGGLVGVALVGLALLGLIGYEVAYYRRFEYELGGDTLDIRSGVISRRNREIPLRRVQNVDISRNVVQRVLGIAVVGFETAGGSETEASLRFVEFEEAKRLQREIGRLKRGVEAEGSEGSPPEETELFALAPGELALVGALSFDARIPGLLFVLLSGSVPAVTSVLPGGSGLLLAAGVVGLGVALLLVAWAAGAAAAVLNYYGFRLARVEDELQYERGLLRRYDGSIPLDKVQTLTVADDPLKRYFGYASLSIETAGYAPGSGSGESGSEAAVPLATRDRVFDLANRIESFGTPAFQRPPKKVRGRYAVRYLLGVGALVGLLYAVTRLTPHALPWYGPVPLALLAPVAAHLKWTHRGYWLGENHFVTRNGVLRRRIKVVPYYRIQTVIDTRTVFQRRWGVATVTADTAGSLSLIGHDAAAVDVDEATAEKLRTTLDARLRESLAARRGWIGEGDETADGETGDGETVDGETADGETVDGETADGETADGETVDGETADEADADPRDDVTGADAGDAAAEGGAGEGS